METDTDEEEPENKVESLVHEVFSWTLGDVLNRNLYKGKVADIPVTFSSVSDYTKSFIYPLFEETHTDLLSNVLGVNRAPTKQHAFIKMKEALKTFQLDSSQEAAVWNCIAARDCRHQNTIKLIWGPPGTGKTKTISSLLHMLLKMKCRTLTCAPTNIAVLGVAKRVIRLVRDSLEYDTYGLGDIILFGNRQRMKIDDCKDLSDIFLSLRVKILSDCVAPLSGWKGCCEWMIRFLEDPQKQYVSYVMQNSRDEDGYGNLSEKEKDDRSIKSNNGESDGNDKDDSSTEISGDEDFRIEEESGDSQIKKALKVKNWNTIIVKTLKEEKHCRSNKNENENENQNEQSLKEISNKKKVLTFEEFVMKGFDFLGNHLISCIKSLYTHMPTSFISVESAKEMIKVVSSLKRLEELLKVAVAENFDLEEALNGFTDSRRTRDSDNLDACRMSSIEILESLQKTLCFPDFKEDYDIRRFCLENASLVFCTASNSINLHTQESNPLEFLVIDEAAQLKECESVIPLRLKRPRHVILVGDERQLPAMVQSKICEEAGFGRSLFERLVSLEHKKHLLEVQYRMHPSISQFQNKEFYDKRILDGANVRSRSYGKRFLQGNMYGSYSFINVTSGKEEFDKGHSMQNLMEVAVIGEIITNLYKESVARKHKVTVGCISPYKAQVNAIQQKLGNKYIDSDYFTVNVRSVDGFQGSEEDVIIISTVRCNAKGSIGFLANRQRANVALTRARYCLWILGNGSTLMNSGSIWRQLVVDAKDRGCFYNVNDDKNLAQAVMFASVEAGQFDSLFNTKSSLFNEAKWQVKFSDKFLETIARLDDREISKKVVSLLIKLSSGWHELEKNGDTKVKIDGACTIVEKYKVTHDLHLIWAVDIVAQNSVCIQVLKFWDVFSGTKIDEQVKMLMEKVYANYTMHMINRCKEKRVQGNLTLPVSWPMNSDTDQSWSLANQLAGLSLEKELSSSSSKASSASGFGNRKSNKFGNQKLQDLMEGGLGGKSYALVFPRK
uniref:uncharacterized protein LOC122604612 n=1 Tax=Erigeron canadensis TaxID=72917 RepID=UPI001CB8DCD6|nr:uncharacterized protein LOC122604612 [Erigeron canadensis]